MKQTNYIEETDFAVTVCDTEGIILYMNQKARRTFLKPGMEDLIGKNVLDCHPEPARTLLKDLLEHPRTNSYTIEKNGVKKLIYQTPWYKNGKYKGFMELSMEIPFQMKHMVRTPAPVSGSASPATDTNGKTRNPNINLDNPVSNPKTHTQMSDNQHNTPKSGKKRRSPNSITELKPGEIFVFGSNLAGKHGGGAAWYAYQKFGAVWGEGVGLHGQTYAIPTMQGGVETIKPYVDQFIAFAMQHPELTFLVTRIGCGIAGFTDEEIAPLFKAALLVDNILLPGSFCKVLEA